METKMEKTLESLAGRLDRILQAPVDGFFNFLDKFFQYSYRETENGVYGLFRTPEDISKAAKESHVRGYTNFDCLTPFPVHGLEFDMGLGRSKVPYITFFAGLTGLCIAFFLQLNVHEQIIPPLWSYLDGLPNLRSYPINIGGKPSFSWPAMVPILFELTVLIGGHTTVAGLILLAKMYRPFRKILHPEITNDRFCLWIPTDSANYDEGQVISFMQSIGAEEIAKVKEGEQSNVAAVTNPATDPQASV
ncbi:MAG: DUF3341 domain-containing protein [Leptospiraceae bacterium]|nr:DUF3341 domain-containing protein [Leptospiraceae bacterium]